MPLSRHRLVHRTCPLSGLKWTHLFALQTSLLTQNRHGPTTHPLNCHDEESRSSKGKTKGYPSTASYACAYKVVANRERIGLRRHRMGDLPFVWRKYYRNEPALPESALEVVHEKARQYLGRAAAATTRPIK